MKLSELYSSDSHASGRDDREGKPFAWAVDEIKKRALNLDSHDRTTKPAKFLYTGTRTIQAGGKDIKTDIMREAGSNRSYALTDDALFQMADRVGPAAVGKKRVNFPGYLRACDEKLRVLNLNAWMQKHGSKELLMRTCNPSSIPVIRSVHSTQYAPIDDSDIITSLVDMPELKDARVHAGNFDARMTNLKIIWPQETRELKEGDIVQHGFYIRNSETGYSSYEIGALVWRCTCANGLITFDENERWRIRHVGKIERIQEAVKEAINSALPASRELAKRFRAAVGEVINRPIETIKALGDEENLTEDMISSAIEEMMGEAKGQDVTRYDLINGLTGAGRASGNAEKRFDMEKLGGKYLTADLPLPKAA